SCVLASVIKELSCTNQCSYMNREGRWRIASCLLPAILRCHRPFADEEATGATNHLKRKEISQSLVLPESPCQQNWKRNLVELNARPVWSTVQPEVLIKAAVFSL